MKRPTTIAQRLPAERMVAILLWSLAWLSLSSPARGQIAPEMAPETVDSVWRLSRLNEAVEVVTLPRLPDESPRPPSESLPLAGRSDETAGWLESPVTLAPTSSVMVPDVAAPQSSVIESSLSSPVRVGYDSGFVVASDTPIELRAENSAYRLRVNGWGQLRHAIYESEGRNPDRNQFGLKRARLTLSGSAFTPHFTYFVQLDGRSSSGDDMRLLDYVLTYDFGANLWGLDPGTFTFKTGKYKMPTTMARYLSGREFEFTDRSMASMFFDVNRSLAWGLQGKTCHARPVHWEMAVFNGLVTGGAETGSAGTLDDNFAYSFRLFGYPQGDWGDGLLADFDGHRELATRVGLGLANSTIDRTGSTEFSRVRVVDTGETLSSIIPLGVRTYSVSIASFDYSAKYRGWSATMEYYLRSIDSFRGAPVPDLFDHGFWLQLGKFIVPGKFQVLMRWSRVVGDSGSLGGRDLSSDEISAGFAWYVRKEHSKLTFDITNLDGATISSDALDVAPGDIGTLIRTQIQFAF